MIKAIKEGLRRAVGMPVPERPKVGVALCVWRQELIVGATIGPGETGAIRDGRFGRLKTEVLMHLRKGTHCGGMYGYAGGHLEYGEAWDECAMRELYEECGRDMVVTAPQFWFAHNSVYRDEGRHYVTIVMKSEWLEGVPVNKEPDRGGDWQWHDWCRMPDKLMLAIDYSVKGGLHPCM
jgi:8-oxo-dGTP diphosphatase